METSLVKRVSPLDKWQAKIESIDDALKYCDVLVKSQITPKSFKTAEAVFAIGQYGAEMGYGLWQALQSFVNVHGNVTLKGAAALARIQASGLLEAMKDENFGDGEDRGVRVTMHRKGQSNPYVGQFTMKDAHRAKLMGKDTYQAYTRDMLYWRAFARASRGFSDVLHGLPIYEDLRHVEVTQVDMTPAAKDQFLLAASGEIVTGDMPQPIEQPDAFAGVMDADLTTSTEATSNV